MHIRIRMRIVKSCLFDVDGMALASRSLDGKYGFLSFGELTRDTEECSRYPSRTDFVVSVVTVVVKIVIDSKGVDTEVWLGYTVLAFRDSGVSLCFKNAAESLSLSGSALVF